ncbi:hypothetical protein BGZ95_000674 [Linnemannia exigua]|uniref:FAD-binding domain-containing protein n=1 Tax=Linnemannia exigua TaxID=604196 RepID=A0AAD4H5G9_9FUNG|nr:hypothetical protein BGZ95_000674 [Linnemannia exigua]
MSTGEKPAVLIVGAGLGGIMLGALLEKSNVPYVIFERTTSVKPLGSAMSVGPNVMPIFQQLGIYDEFLTISNPLNDLTYFSEDMKEYKPIDHRPVQGVAGYGYRVVARPMLYGLLLRLVPEQNILYGRRVLNISEDYDKVTVHITKHESYEGDIIVGADGAYSAVRQRMYQQLKAKGELPKTDFEELPFSYTCLLGQTRPLSPEEFPCVDNSYCQFNTILGTNKPYTWVTLSTAQKTLCWMVVHHLDRKASKEATEQRFRTSENSEWGAYPAQTMCNETRDFPIQLNDGMQRTLGELYDRTPAEQISKIMLEEKVFDTWYSGRTVLLGDACHKIHPSSGQGGITAIHDAIALANLLYALPSCTSEEVTKIFEEYRAERFPVVKHAFKFAQLIKQLVAVGIVGAITFHVFTHLPKWLWKVVFASNLRSRPQVGFLPEIKSECTVAPIDSPSFIKAKAVYEETLQRVASV